MVPVCGRPFMEYQLELLSHSGVDDLVICLGHLGHIVEQYFGDGRRFGIRIRYGYERDRLLGTAGAVKNVEEILRDVFFVVNGDTYPVIDLTHVMQHFLGHDRVGLMMVFRNDNRWDRSNVILDGSFVRVYDKEQALPGMVCIDFGVSVFRRVALAHIPAGTRVDLSVVYNALIERQQLLAYETAQRFYEVGSHEGLREFEALVQSGAIDTLSGVQHG